MLKSLQRLRGALGQPPHTYRPTVQTFNDLDVQRLERSLDIGQWGKTRGEQQQPATDAKTFDALETEIVEQIGAAQKLAHGEVYAQLSTFKERLTALDFESRFGATEEAAQGGLADLKAEQQMALDDLHGLRRDLSEAEAYLKLFREKHRITHPAQRKSTLGLIVKLLIIALLVVGEIVANGFFLSAGNELGMIGGIVEAIIFSVLNVGVALFFAIVLIPNLSHRNIVRKFLGLVSFFGFLAWTAALNLGLAHYREAAGTREPTVAFAEQARDAVMVRLQTRPLELDQFESWLLFAIGVLFALVALIDGLSLTERYPGYQKVDENVRARRKAYADERRAKIQDLSDVRQQYQDAVTLLRIDIGKRRTEHQSILSHRLSLLKQFEEHQNQLEKAANQLLRCYRDTNVAARSTPPPAYFDTQFKLERLSVSLEDSAELTAEALQAKVDAAQQQLQRVMAQVTEEFEKGLARYRELDDLTPDRASGTA